MKYEFSKNYPLFPRLLTASESKGQHQMHDSQLLFVTVKLAGIKAES